MLFISYGSGRFWIKQYISEFITLCKKNILTVHGNMNAIGQGYFKCRR